MPTEEVGKMVTVKLTKQNITEIVDLFGHDAEDTVPDGYWLEAMRVEPLDKQPIRGSANV